MPWGSYTNPLDNAFGWTARGASSVAYSYPPLGGGDYFDIYSVPGLAAYYDASNGTSLTYDANYRVSQWNDLSGLSGRNLLQGTGSAQPLLLPWSGTNYLFLPQTAGNSATSPTQSLTGNQTITADWQGDSYTPGTNDTLFTKISGNNGIALLLLTSGKLRLQIGDGSAITNYDSSVAVSLTAGTRHTLQAVYTDGGSGNVIFNVDGAQLGTTVSTTKTLANAATSAQVGLAAGKLYLLTVGPYRMDASQATDGATSWVSSTGETWTVNQSGGKPAQIVGKSSVLFDGSAYYMKTAAFTLNQPTTVVLIGKQNVWTIDTAIFDGNSGDTMELAKKVASPQVKAYAGTLSSSLSSWSLGQNGVVQVCFNGASSFLRLNRGASVSGDFGSSNGGGFTLGAVATGAGLSSVQVTGVLIFNQALSTTALDQIALWAARKYSIAGV